MFSFGLVHMAPGDPVNVLLGPYASEEDRATMRSALALDQPVPVQYGRWLGRTVTGDLGTSIQLRTPVRDVLFGRFANTLRLGVPSFLLALVVGLAAGALAALRTDGILDRTLQVLVVFSGTMPIFWLALLLILTFALANPIGFTWLPAGSWVPFSEDKIGWLRSLILPSLSIALPVGGFLTRVVRSSVLDELEKDYVRTARGMGLRDRVIVRKNVLRNALVAPLTVLGLQAGYILGGVVLVERVFNLRGLGWKMIDSATTGDFNIVTGIAMVGALLFVLSNLAADVAFVIFKPSARESS
jgi:peptide/nickel transport system permease protein